MNKKNLFVVAAAASLFLTLDASACPLVDISSRNQDMDHPRCDAPMKGGAKRSVLKYPTYKDQAVTIDKMVTTDYNSRGRPVTIATEETTTRDGHVKQKRTTATYTWRDDGLIATAKEISSEYGESVAEYVYDDNKCLVSWSRVDYGKDGGAPRKYEEAYTCVKTSEGYTRTRIKGQPGVEKFDTEGRRILDSRREIPFSFGGGNSKPTETSIVSRATYETTKNGNLFMVEKTQIGNEHERDSVGFYRTPEGRIFMRWYRLDVKGWRRDLVTKQDKAGNWTEVVWQREGKGKDGWVDGDVLVRTIEY